MTLIPAIDLLDGACVRLTKGDYGRVDRYSPDPVEVARGFQAAGARWIHLVDLDAARAASAADSGPAAADNRRIIRAITGAVSCSVEVGGGIRSYEDVEELLQAGARRLVLGTVLVRRPQEVSRWCALHPGALWAGIDAERGQVKVAGWMEAAALRDGQLAREAQQMGLGGIVYTSIGRDGTLQGPDVEATNRIAAASGLPVILSGGIGGPEDVQRVWTERHPNVEGVIIGKAIYQGRVDLGRLYEMYPPEGSSG